MNDVEPACRASNVCWRIQSGRNRPTALAAVQRLATMLGIGALYGAPAARSARKVSQDWVEGATASPPGP
jgi:hypothetical protein